MGLNRWISIQLDENGNPRLIDEDVNLNLASAKFNKTVSNVAGTTRQTSAGNPWFDAATGRFANGPAGVTVKGGAELLKLLLNSSKAYISAQAKAVGANAMTAMPAGNGKVKIVLFKGDQELLVFIVTTNQASPAQAKTDSKPANTSELPSSIPANVDPIEWARRMDQVREAAREFDPQELEDIKEWLQGKTNRDLTPEELQSFLDDVNRQRISDLVDVLDHSIRRRVATRLRGRRLVRIAPPRGWVRRTLANIDDNGIIEIHRRLRSRGFSEEELELHLINRYPEDRRDKLKARI